MLEHEAKEREAETVTWVYGDIAVRGSRSVTIKLQGTRLLKSEARLPHTTILQDRPSVLSHTNSWYMQEKPETPSA